MEDIRERNASRCLGAFPYHCGLKRTLLRIDPAHGRGQSGSVGGDDIAAFSYRAVARTRTSVQRVGIRSSGDGGPARCWTG